MSTPVAPPTTDRAAERRRAEAWRRQPAATPGRAHLGLVGLIAAVAVEWAGATAILPILPLLLRHRGVPVALVGVVMAAFLGAGFLAQYPLGRLADRIGRRRLLQSSLWCYALATLGFVLGGPVVLAIVFRALQGAAAGGADVAAQALVVDLVPARRHGRAYAMLAGAQMGGMVVGPIAGSLLAGISVNLVFFVGAGAAAAASLVLRRALPAARRQPRAEVAAAWSPDWRILRGVLAISAAGGLLLGVYEADWTLLMHRRGASGWEIGVSFALYALPLVLLSWPAGWLADHWDRRWLSGTALGAAAACAALYPLLPSAALLIALSAVEATLSAAGYPATLSLLARAVGPAAAGRGQGLYASVQTGTAALGAAIGGVLFGAGVAVPFVASAVLALATVAVLPWLWRGTGPDRRPATIGTGSGSAAVPGATGGDAGMGTARSEPALRPPRPDGLGRTRGQGRLRRGPWGLPARPDLPATPTPRP